MQSLAIPQASPCAPAIMADAIQDAVDSLASGLLGANRPAGMPAGGCWSKQVSATSIRRFFFDGTNDILIAEYNPVTHAQVDLGIPDLSIGVGKLATIPSGRMLGRVNVGTGSVEVLTMAQVMANLPDFVGDSGSGGVAGRVPAPSAGDASAGKFLKANGAWAAPPSGLDPGAIMDFAMETAPAGWLECYGQAVSRATYANLYAAIGDTWGAGNGATTFNLPDFRGRVRAGLDDMGGVSADRLTNFAGGINGDAIAAVGGSEKHQLTVAEMPSHNHTITVATNDTGGNSKFNFGGGSSTVGTSSTGGGGAHNNVQPTVIVLTCIKI